MTQDEIQELVNQATEEHGWGANYFDIPKFANLVAAKALAQRRWVGLTDEDRKQISKEANYNWEMTTGEYAERIGQLTETKLKEKNT